MSVATSPAALVLALAACTTAQNADFTLKGEQIKSARYSAWGAQCGAHCVFGENPETERYLKASCRWTSGPSVADCRFNVSHNGGPTVADRQLIERRGSQWVAIWPDETAQ
jgi:hypothetical protein